MQYPGLQSHGSHALAKRLLRPNAFGGVLSFGVTGNAKVGSQVVDKLKLASHLANVGELEWTEGTWQMIADLRAQVTPRHWLSTLPQQRTNS